jgi:hypothetical protein
VRPGAYPRVEYLKGASLRKASALPTNTRLGWKGLPGTNTNLLRKPANYGRIKVYVQAPGYIDEKALIVFFLSY